MRHLWTLLVVSLLVLGFAGYSVSGSNVDLTKEGVSGISYGRVKCPTCGFEFDAAVKEPLEDLTKDGVSGISYGRVKCAECGFEFTASAKGPVEDLTQEGVSGISYGRVKCPTCGFEFDAPDSKKDRN